MGVTWRGGAGGGAGVEETSLMHRSDGNHSNAGHDIQKPRRRHCPAGWVEGSVVGALTSAPRYPYLMQAARAVRTTSAAAVLDKHTVSDLGVIGGGETDHPRVVDDGVVGAGSTAVPGNGWVGLFGRRGFEGLVFDVALGVAKDLVGDRIALGITERRGLGGAGFSGD